jgi:hypothetical protein
LRIGSCGSQVEVGRNSGPLDGGPVKIRFQAEQPSLIDLPVIADLQAAESAIEIERGGLRAGATEAAAASGRRQEEVIRREGDRRVLAAPAAIGADIEAGPGRSRGRGRRCGLGGHVGREGR